MTEITATEIDWGSDLHRKLIAEKARLRDEWRKSPSALEEVRQMASAPQVTWEGAFSPAPQPKKLRIYVWKS